MIEADGFFDKHTISECSHIKLNGWHLISACCMKRERPRKKPNQNKIQLLQCKLQIRNLALWFDQCLDFSPLPFLKHLFAFANHWMVSCSLLFTNYTSQWKENKTWIYKFPLSQILMCDLWMQNVPIILQTIVCCCYWIVLFSCLSPRYI